MNENLRTNFTFAKTVKVKTNVIVSVLNHISLSSGEHFINLITLNIIN